MTKRIRKTALIYLMSFFISVTAFAQERTVTGKVLDGGNGDGLPGASITIKGTSIGVITDLDGNYSISVGDGAVLVVSFVGYTTKEIEVGSQSVIDVTLESDEKTLSEVVVVGYGVQDKKEITSAVTSVQAKDFNKGAINDPTQLLQGKVSGLVVARPGGSPNDGFSIRLRGISTFGANSEPLIVIDGVVRNTMENLDPNDIASIDILKDGSAAAIYGTRGSSGVILITTKRGVKGKPTIEFNQSYSIENIANTIDFMSASEYRAVKGASVIDFGGNTDWLKEVTRTGSNQITNLSIAGGGDNTTYRMAVNYRKSEGVGLNTGFDRLNFRLNLRQKALNDILTFDANISTSTSNIQYGFKQAFRYAVSANPTLPVHYNDAVTGAIGIGGYSERDIFDFYNPVSLAKQGINDGKREELLVSLKSEVDLKDVVKGLTTDFFFSVQRKSDLNGGYLPQTTKFYGANLLGGYAGRQSFLDASELFETTIRYRKDIGSTSFAILVGHSLQKFKYEGFEVLGGNFVSDQFTYNNLNAALQFNQGLGKVFSYANSQVLEAGFGRINLTLMNAIFISGSARYEGSSRFGKNNKYGLFSSASGGVDIAKLITIPMFSELKLRLSWGRTGALPSASYKSIPRVGPQGSFYYNGAYVQTYGPVSNANPNLAWEKKDEIDFGIDFTAFSGKLSGTFDYYNRTTTDLLLTVNVPVPPNLFPQSLVNIGELSTNGWEVALNYEAVKTNDFSWTTGINLSGFKTRVESLSSGGLSFGNNGVLYRAFMGVPGQGGVQLVRVKEGEEFGQLWGPVFDGVNDDGTPKFKDLNGDGKYCNCDDDRQVVGNGLPSLIAGWNNTLTYKNFDLNFFFRGAFGHDLVNTYRGFYENYAPGTIGSYNIVKGPGLDKKITTAIVNSSHVESADFIRLDNATLGYNVNPSKLKGLTKVRLYISVQNAFTITNYSGIDPEVRFSDVDDSINVFGYNGLFGARTNQAEGADALSPGIERRDTYFTTRIVTFGVNLGF